MARTTQAGGPHSQTGRLTVMVSSTVYGIEPLLDQIFAILKEDGFGYRVWMSYKGTIPLDPRKSNLQNCLDAVERCDLFLGIITGRYGSGIVGGQTSITHQEIQRAVALDKPRWFLVHRDVTVAREVLKQFRYRKDGTQKRLPFRKTAVLEDLRVLDMYDCAIRQDLPVSDRTGNWVQPYITHADALLYIQTQFSEPSRVKILIPQPRQPEACDG
jgi:uncharacterized protein DUF4062